jgi:hypothetical protein
MILKMRVRRKEKCKITKNLDTREEIFFAGYLAKRVMFTY